MAYTGMRFLGSGWVFEDCLVAFSETNAAV